MKYLYQYAEMKVASQYIIYVNTFTTIHFSKRNLHKMKIAKKYIENIAKLYLKGSKKYAVDNNNTTRNIETSILFESWVFRNLQVNIVSIMFAWISTHGIDFCMSIGVKNSSCIKDQNSQINTIFHSIFLFDTLHSK